MGRVAGLLWVAVALIAQAGDASAQSLEATCSPPCRDGYACLNGACETICNPRCPAGTECLDGRRCEPVAAQCNPPCPAGTSCVDGRRCEGATTGCLPACREGYVCNGGECLVGESGQGVTITPGTTPADPAAPAGPVAPAPPIAPAPPTDAEAATDAETAPAETADEAAEEADEGGPRTLLFKMRFGMGGTLSWEDQSSPPLTDEADLTGTVGVAIEKDWILISSLVDISLGLQLSGLWWNTQVASDLGVGRSTMIELDVVPKVSYTVLPSLHVYLAVPVGISASFMRNDAGGTAFTEVGVGWGWNLSVMAGVQYDLSLVAVFLELGADIHNFSHTVSNRLGGGEQDLSFDFSQFALNLGLAF